MFKYLKINPKQEQSILQAIKDVKPIVVSFTKVNDSITDYVLLFTSQSHYTAFKDYLKENILKRYALNKLLLV